MAGTELNDQSPDQNYCQTNPGRERNILMEYEFAAKDTHQSEKTDVYAEYF